MLSAGICPERFKGYNKLYEPKPDEMYIQICASDEDSDKLAYSAATDLGFISLAYVLYAGIERPDQTARMSMLIWNFIVFICAKGPLNVSSHAIVLLKGRQLYLN